MLSKVRIIEKESNNYIGEYPIEVIDDSLKEYYFDEAWKNAVDEFNRLDYEIRFVDEGKLEDLTNPSNQHPLPNP